MSSKKYDTKTLEKLHEVELEILDKVDKICKKNNLEYCLSGGSMLGAVRHSGFIPWDDDIDIVMSRKDYDIFIGIAQKELGSKYYLDCFETNKDYYLPFAKVRKNNTIFDEEANHHLNNHKGIYIDIIPIDNAKKQKSFFQKVQAFIAKNITNAMFLKKKISKLESNKHKVFVVFLTFFSCKTLMKFQNKIMRLNKNENSDYIVALAGSYNYMKETMPRNVFFPAKKIKFCNKEYYGMNDSDYYLTRLFGNYMELPPEDERVNHCPLNIKF